MGEWTLFSNHGHVLVCLMRDSEARLRDVADQVGITERAVQKIVRELQDAAFITVSKHGRCNHYRINTRKSLRHELEAHCTVGKLLQALTGKPARPDKGATGPAVEGASTNIPERPATSTPIPAPVAREPEPEPEVVPEAVPDEPVRDGPDPMVEPDSGDAEMPGANQQGSLF